jgi:hypothetical protein
MSTTHSSGAEESRFSVAQEFRLIPPWSMVAAAISFVAIQYIFWVLMPKPHHHPAPPFGLRVYFSLSWSALAALYVLMIGYVSKDSPRRNMSTRLWILVCLVLPGGVGAVLYFLLRQPVVSTCPACGTDVLSEYHYCPQCAYQISAACGKCYRSVQATDLFCVHCGHDLLADNLPERLRALHLD